MPALTFRWPSTFRAWLPAHARWSIARVISRIASACGLPFSRCTRSASSCIRRARDPRWAASRCLRPSKPSARHVSAAGRARSTVSRTASASCTGKTPTTAPVAGSVDSKVSVVACRSTVPAEAAVTLSNGGTAISSASDMAGDYPRSYPRVGQGRTTSGLTSGVPGSPPDVSPDALGSAELIMAGAPAMLMPVADPFDTAAIRRRVLAAWADSPARFREDANAEEDLVRGGYRDRLLGEVAQTAADAAVRAGVPGRLRLELTGDELRAANTGEPLDAAGVQALA